MVRNCILCFISLFIFSCSGSRTETECAGFICDTAGNTVYILFLDAETDENLLDYGSIQNETVLITDGTTEVSHATVENTEVGTILYFNVNPANYGNRLFNITFDGGQPFTISFQTSYIEGGCCGPFTGIDDIEISTYTNEFSTSGVLPLTVTLYID